VDTILRLAQVRRTPPLPPVLAEHVSGVRAARSDIAPAPDYTLPATDRMPANVPVHGTAVGGDTGDFRLNGTVVDWARRPPGIAHLKDAWCVYVQSDSMSPWREPGELVYLHPSRPPRPGDYVVVELHTEHGEPGPAFLKKLVARTPTRLRLAQWNPRRDDIEIELARVKSIYRVIDWSELLGV
jgi:phage repressor protein C with HTH and peptisase S24 domain